MYINWKNMYNTSLQIQNNILLVGFVLLDLLFYVYVLQIVVCPFVLFLLAFVLSVLLRYTDSDYPFGIFKLFLSIIFQLAGSVQNIAIIKDKQHQLSIIFQLAGPVQNIAIIKDKQHQLNTRFQLAGSVQHIAIIEDKQHQLSTRFQLAGSVQNIAIIKDKQHQLNMRFQQARSVQHG